MTEPSMIPYQKVSKDVSVAPKKKNNKWLYFYNIFGLFLSMSSVYGNMTPFGLVFLTLERNFKKSTIFAFIAVVIGSIMLDSKLLSAKYIVAEVVYFSILFVLEKGVKISLFASTASAVVSLLLSGVIIMYWQGITLYTVAELMVELLLTGVGVVVFDRCKNIFFKKNVEFDNLEVSSRVCVCIVSGLLLLSLKSFFIGTSISVINVAAAALIMCIGIGTSAPYTAAAGVIIGMLCGIETDYFLPLIGAFGFCGFLSGIFSRFGKSGAAVGLILANAVLTVYTNNAIEPMLKIYEILLSIVFLIFIPDKFIENTRKILELKTSEKENIARLKANIRQKLKYVSESFLSMAKAIEKLSSETSKNENTDFGKLFDNVADKVCVTCKKTDICWGRDFNKTYRAFFSIFDVMKTKGEIEVEDLNSTIKNSCIKIDKLLDELSVQYDTLRLKKIWEGKLEENRELTGQQLLGMSKILDDLAGDIDIKTENITSDKVRKELEAKGFKPKSTDVFEDRSGKVKVSFMLKKNSLKNGGEGRIFRCLKNIFEREIHLSVYETSNDGYVRINAFETEKYTVEKGFACASVDKNSGDNFGFYKLSSGKYVITLSDGMGTGLAASKESRAVIELMDSFLRAGFDKKIAVKLINSVLLMKSENQCFATIDMCIIDLYTGSVEFIKTGAEPSYIKSSTDVLSVSASSLPIGITAKAEPEFFCYNLDDGDLIVMATDGMQSKKDGDGWLRKFIEEDNISDGAKCFAERLLKKAEEINKGVKDDMTVISVKLHKKAC